MLEWVSFPSLLSMTVFCSAVYCYLFFVFRLNKAWIMAAWIRDLTVCCSGFGCLLWLPAGTNTANKAFQLSDLSFWNLTRPNNCSMDQISPILIRIDIVDADVLFKCRINWMSDCYREGDLLEKGSIWRQYQLTYRYKLGFFEGELWGWKELKNTNFLAEEHWEIFKNSQTIVN